MTRSVFIAALAALAVSACASTPPQSAPVDVPVVTDVTEVETVTDACGAQAREYLLGQPVSEVDLESLARVVRTINPGQPVTMDYLADRVNLDLDGDGVIVRIWCG
tara:strand:+ start:16746 stop:17063 length:318 start_codon:yes stop_codon:yes gene_type:complete